MDKATLTKGQIRKLTALKKSIGDDLGTMAFTKWLKTQKSATVDKVDPNAVKLQSALSVLESDSSFKLGAKGYSIKRAKGKGASGFIVSKNT